jgi:Carboxypeptidase regulatory-like domain
MRLLALAALLPLALPAAAQAQRAPARAPGSVLLLQVRDEQGRPLSDAQVVVAGVNRSGRSDATGEAFVNQIPEGNRLVELTRPGYGQVRVAADFAGTDTVRREVRMTPQPVELEGVVATSWGRSMRLRRNGFYDRQRRGMGAYMTSDRIELLHPLRTVDIFRYMRGFLVRQTSSGPIVVGTRGNGIGNADCMPTVYVDGTAMVSQSKKTQHDAIDMIRPDDLLAVEAYPGPATIPAEYNPLGSACGVILFWTRGGSGV